MPAIGMRATWIVGVAACVGLACAAGDTTGGDGASFGVGGAGGEAGTAGDGGTFGNDVSGGGDGDGTLGQTSGVDGGDDDGGDGPACQDADGDNFGINCAAGEDCNDDDPDVNPGAAETCDGVDQNCDDMIDNGCDCPDDGISGDCNAPQDLGMLAVGDSVLSVVGNVPQEGSLDWYSVSFPAPARPGEGTPTIFFSINEGDAFVFDVVAEQCGANGVACTSGGTNGVGIGLTDWSFVDDDPGCCTAPMDSMVPWPNQVFLRVYRTTMGASCATYQLNVSR
jgi:hypothetical protein